MKIGPFENLEKVCFTDRLRAGRVSFADFEVLSAKGNAFWRKFSCCPKFVDITRLHQPAQAGFVNAERGFIPVSTQNGQQENFVQGVIFIRGVKKRGGKVRWQERNFKGQQAASNHVP